MQVVARGGEDAAAAPGGKLVSTVAAASDVEVWSRLIADRCRG
jgi:hypothetical protein